MKKALLSALFVAGMGSLLSSCNNGDYDAKPEESEGTYLNPLNPNSGVTVPIGYIRCEIGGSVVDFMSGTWTNNGGLAILSALRADNAFQVQVVSMSLTGFNGVGTYNVTAGSGVGTIQHYLYDPNDPNYIALGYTSAMGDGNGVINVEGVEDGNIRGTFSGTLVQELPVVNTANKEVITNGKFYLKTAPQQ